MDRAKPEQGAPPAEATMPNEPRADAAASHAELLAQLGTALLHCNTSAPRVDAALRSVAERLGIEASFFCTPTSFLFTLIENGHTHTRLERISPGALDLGRIAAIHAVLDELEAGQLTPDAAAARLTALDRAPPSRHPLVEVAGHGLVSVAFDLLLGGDLQEVAIAAALGLLSGLAVRLGARSPRRAPMMPVLAATVAAAVAWALADLGWPVRPVPLSIAATMSFSPGLSIVLGMTELAANHLIAGTARLAGGVVRTLLVVFGVAIGEQLGALLVSPQDLEHGLTISQQVAFLAPALGCLGFTLSLRARWRDLGRLMLVAYVALGATWLIGRHVGPVLAGLCATVLMTLVSHALETRGAPPAVVTQLPALLLTVPGTTSLFTAQAMLHRDVDGALQAAFRVLLVALAIAAGLMLGEIAAPQRRRG